MDYQGAVRPMDFFADTLLGMNFQPSGADPDLWIKFNTEQDGYDYIATHMDDSIISAKNPEEYIS